jgi:hypothetical protein
LEPYLHSPSAFKGCTGAYLLFITHYLRLERYACISAKLVSGGCYLYIVSKAVICVVSRKMKLSTINPKHYGTSLSLTVNLREMLNRGP